MQIHSDLAGVDSDWFRQLYSATWLLAVWPTTAPRQIHPARIVDCFDRGFILLASLTILNCRELAANLRTDFDPVESSSSRIFPVIVNVAPLAIYFRGYQTLQGVFCVFIEHLG